MKAKLREYKPIIDLYREAEKHERRAYLYEFAGCDEYLSDYLEYKMLVDRLEKGYSKTINEVAEYVEEEESQILYAKAQAKELSSVYHTILRFAQNELSQQEAEYLSLYEAIGYTKARTAAVHHQFVSSDTHSFFDVYYDINQTEDAVDYYLIITKDFAGNQTKKKLTSQRTLLTMFRTSIDRGAY